MSKPPVRSRFSFSGLRITRGALIVAGLELGFSLVWLLADVDTRAKISTWLEAIPANVFEHGRVWTLASGVFLERDLVALILHVSVLWMFVPTLERFWGTARFYRFVIITSLIGTGVGCAVGYLLGYPYDHIPISGLNPFIYASIVAFGIIYARQPVQFFGVLPLTGRQLMWGFLAFLTVYVVLTAAWTHGAAFAAAMLAAAVMTSKRWSPSLAWKKWRLKRARARLTVMPGGKKREEKWLN